MKSKPPKCLVPGCSCAVVARGLCRFDYNLALGLVDKGDTTWEALIAEGKALPKHGERRSTSARKFFLSK